MLPQQADSAPGPSRPRVVLHVDLDAFFVQVERKLNPTLIGVCGVSFFLSAQGLAPVSYTHLTLPTKA